MINESFRLSRRRASCRGGAAAGSPRRSARRSMSIPPRRSSGTTGLRRRLRRRCDATDLLCGEGQLQPGGAAHLGRLGAGADVVSEGEMRRALAAGVPPERIVFSGVGKTRGEMAPPSRPASRRSTSNPQPELAAARPRWPGRWASAPRRHPGQPRRRGPDPRQDLHRQGREQVRRLARPGRARSTPTAARMAGIEPVGVAVPYRQPDHRARALRGGLRQDRALVARLRADGHAIERLDLGGGLGVAYRERRARRRSPRLRRDDRARRSAHLGCQLVFEPGRLMVGQRRGAGRPRALRRSGRGAAAS